MARAERARRRRLVAVAILAGLLTLLVGAVVLASSGSGGSHAPGSAAATATNRSSTTASTSTSKKDPHTPILTASQRRVVREDRAVQATLERMPYVLHAAGHKKQIALTFDDGPGPYTPKVIDALKSAKAPATFFTVGFMIGIFHPTLTREIRDGFVIGDHTESHKSLPSLNKAGQTDQIVTQTQWLSKYKAPKPNLFRPPYGAVDKTALKILRRHHLLTVMWSVDTEDYKQPGTPTIVHNALSGATPGGIILMHDAGGVRTQTIAAIPQIVKGLRARGYTLVTVPRLLADDPPIHPQTLPKAFGNVG